jgi:hypothetical protein
VTIALLIDALESAGFRLAGGTSFSLRVGSNLSIVELSVVIPDDRWTRRQCRKEFERAIQKAWFRLKQYPLLLISERELVDRLHAVAAKWGFSIEAKGIDPNVLMFPERVQ